MILTLALLFCGIYSVIYYTARFVRRVRERQENEAWRRHCAERRQTTAQILPFRTRAPRVRPPIHQTLVEIQKRKERKLR